MSTDQALGEAMGIKAVARLLGCSVWTVRQKWMRGPHRLPSLRSGPNGRLTFFRNQVVAWVLEQQRKAAK
jgi:hypothetical protein